MQNKNQSVNKCAWTEVNERHLINVSNSKETNGMRIDCLGTFYSRNSNYIELSDLC